MREPAPKGTYARINLDNIVHNYKQACMLTGKSVVVSCVVKADAYGHGETQVVRTLAGEGAGIFCVSTMEEAIRLRKQFPDIDILILGYTPAYLADKVPEYNLIQTISTLEEARALNQEGKSKVHIKFNTGMNRLGFSPDETDDVLMISRMENISVEGVFTHLHSSDGENPDPTLLQFNEFRRILDELERRGMDTGIRHVCNSGGIISYNDMHLDMVRAGIMLYGLFPSGAVKREDVDLRECMELRSYIARINDVRKGEGISYGHTYIAEKDMKTATVDIGYSDGVFRSLGNKGEVIIHDERRPIVGRVCMNMLVVDITGMDNVRVGDEVILFGRDKNSFISIDEVAEWAGTISYEVICRTGCSVPRAYYRNDIFVESESEYF